MPENIIVYWASDDLQLREQGEGDNLSRVLSGTVVRYGDTATVKTHGIVIRERIVAGAFGDIKDVDITAVLQHDRSRGLARSGYGLTLHDTPTELRADIALIDDTDGTDAYKKFKAGILRGLSAEFVPQRSIVQAGVLIRQQAKLVRIGVVDTPAYPDSLLEERQAEILALSPPVKPAFDPWR